MIPTLRHSTSDAAVCRANGWTAGTRLVGDEGYGPTIITITAVGESALLAKSEHNGREYREGRWTLRYRDWQEVQ